MAPRRGGRRAVPSALGFAALATFALLALAAPVAAHSGTLRGATREPLAVPLWLFLLTGGGAIGASFLAASFVTDRAFVRALHRWGRAARAPLGALRVVGRLLGLAALVAVVAVGLIGPPTAIRNLAILVVWVGWWGAFVASTYLVGNAWPAVDPFRTLAGPLPSLDRPLPDVGAWPSVVGLLLLVWIEVVTPLADDPRLLALVVAGYAALSLAGSAVFGADRWFGTVDPLSRAFRYYGAVAPLAVEDGRLRLRLPGGGLQRLRLGREPGAVAFVVGVLFVTTYDGFVATGLWAGAVEAVVAAGVQPLLAYTGAYLVGFGLFLGAYRLAARLARRAGPTYLSRGQLARRFAPPLLAIAAGYHLAHNLGSVLTLAPAFLTVVGSPLAPPQNPPVLAGLPGWFPGLELAFVLLGHVLAVWVAHGIGYDLFPGRLQAVRSQYGVTAAMVVYTMVSLWIVSQPYVRPPFL